MTMTTTPTKEEIEALEAADLVTVRPHNTLPLRIVNYTPRAQYERAWTPALLQCRGLVYDEHWHLVARPLPKFFNYEEHLGENPPAGPLPSGVFTVTEKYDGSLGILFRWQDHLVIATRGSFHSEQAERASKMLYPQFSNAVLSKLQPGFTHLFEIIYPENRIVVDYGKEERLQWLTSIEVATGREVPMFSQLFGPITSHLGDDPLHFRRQERINAEGYVLLYENGQRVKIKHETYVELHRLVTGLSTTSIWEVLRAGKNPMEALTNLPDELYGWAERTTAELAAKHTNTVLRAYEEMRRIQQEIGANGTRKDFATLAQQRPDRHLLFMALDDATERLHDAVWKLIEPVRQKPITADEC